jgi:geranylgeranyl diphosphate synthase, type III
MVIDDIISMLHNASLMIDDIEDGSTLRRGEPAAHVVYGVPLTINAAELTCFLAMQKAMTLNHPQVGRILIGKYFEQ